MNKNVIDFAELHMFEDAGSSEHMKMRYKQCFTFAFSQMCMFLLSSTSILKPNLCHSFT